MSKKIILEMSATETSFVLTNPETRIFSRTEGVYFIRLTLDDWWKSGGNTVELAMQKDTSARFVSYDVEKYSASGVAIPSTFLEDAGKIKVWIGQSKEGETRISSTAELTVEDSTGRPDGVTIAVKTPAGSDEGCIEKIRESGGQFQFYGTQGWKNIKTSDETDTALNGKVDKVEGKGLSTNDYTNEEKAEVAKVSGKVDKVSGKGLSTNDYTDSAKSFLEETVPEQIDRIDAKIAEVEANVYSNFKNKVDKVAGKGLSTNDFTNEDKAEVAKVAGKADIYDVERVTSNNHFNASAAITGKALNVGGTIIDYATGVLSDKIPVKGKYVVCSASEAMTGTTACRIAGYKTVDGVETFVTGTYNFPEPKIAYTTKSGQTRYRTASEIDYSSCEYIRISTTTTDVAKSYMVGFTDKNLSAYNEDYDEYSKTLDKYLSDDIKVKKTEAAFVAIENNNAKHLSIHKAMSQFILSDKTLKIKLLGDSITEGYGGTGFVQSSKIGVETNTSGVCWANMLREYMTAKFGCTFVNLGSSGMNSQTMYNNIFVTPNLIDGSEDVVLLMIGTNDRKTNTKATFFSNLKAIIEKIQANGTKVVIMSSIPSSAKEEAITTNAYHMDDVDDIIMKVATDLNIEYISLYKLFDKHLRYSGAKLTDYLNSDGLHPNDEGYKVMYKLILSALGFADDGAVTLPQFPVSLNDKVDKVEGKGLSTNDYTDAEKVKVASLPYATLSLEDYDTRKRGYIAADGEYTASGSWFSYYFYTDKYPIKKISAKLYSNSTAAYSIAFYSAKDSIASNLISGIKPTAAGANLISFDNVSVPENAALIVIATRFASGASSAAELFVNLNIPAAEIFNIDNTSEKTGQIKRIFTDFPNANDFTFVKGELWGSAASGDKTVISRYKITDDGLLMLGIIHTDFGHLNCFDYNPANDCLIFGNGGNDFSTEGNWFAVVKNPMGLVTSEWSANATLAANATVYNVDIGFKVQAVWGASNLGLNNIVYLLSNNAKTVTKVMLNVDDNGEFNGQFTVLDTHTSETAYPVGGAKFWGDTLYFGYSDTGYKIAKMSMSDYSVSVTKRQLYEANGTEISGTVQGLHIDDKYVWVFINATNPIRYYLIQMYQCLGSLSGGSGGAGTTITVDAELSATSKNPVQNKAVKAALDKKIEKPTNISEGLFGFNSVGLETIKEIITSGSSVELSEFDIPNGKALKEYVAAKNVNLLSKPTSNGIVGYMSGIGSLTYTLNTSMPESPSHAGILSAKAVYDYINGLDASEVSY